jgi:hypothetical protein
LIVLDPEIIADGHHLLAHLVVVTTAAWSSKLAIITSFFSSTWHNITSLKHRSMLTGIINLSALLE